MRLPSVTGVEVAGLLISWTFSISLVGAAARHRILPFARLSAISSSLLDTLSNAVTKMRSSQMQGEPWPVGSSVFHSTDFAGPNSTGGRADSLPAPLPAGPRNWGH